MKDAAQDQERFAGRVFDPTIPQLSDVCARVRALQGQSNFPVAVLATIGVTTYFKQVVD